MQTLTQIKQLLSERGLAPNRALGQNFLCDHHLIRTLVESSGVGPGDLVLEVGPGTGTLTEELLARGCEVVACELDRGLADLLRERFGGSAFEGATPVRGRFTLVEGDCLAGKHRLNEEVERCLAARPFRLVANLPYGAASPLMILLAARRHPKLCAAGVAPCLGQFVTIQKEVAERLRARPGSKDYGPMAVLVQAAARVERLATLSPGCFWPQPKVTSEMVAIRPLEEPVTSALAPLERLCEVLFSQRRKQIGTILSRAGFSSALELHGSIDPSARPEALTIQQLVELSRLIGERSA